MIVSLGALIADLGLRAHARAWGQGHKQESSAICTGLAALT